MPPRRPPPFVQRCYRYMRQTIEVDAPILSIQTPYQELVLFKNDFLGHVLALDGVIQLTSRDEFAYSEMLAHPPLCLHPRPRRVLIIGGGDLLVLEEVLKHPEIQHVTLVDLDGAVIDACKQHLQHLHRDAWADPRAQIHIGDGAAFVQAAADQAAADPGARFDIILSDGPDPLGVGSAGQPLYSPAFFDACAQLLAPGGLFVTQCDVPFHHGGALVDTLASMRAFPDRHTYLCAVPTFDGGFNAMILGRVGPDLPDPRAPLRPPPPDLGYYTPEIHRAAFALPPYIARIVEG